LQLLILIRDTASAFHVDEQSAGLCALKGTMTGEHLFLEVNTCFFVIWLGEKKLTSVTTHRDRNVSGSKARVVGRTCEEVMYIKFRQPDGVSLHYSTRRAVL